MLVELYGPLVHLQSHSGARMMCRVSTAAKIGAAYDWAIAACPRRPTSPSILVGGGVCCADGRSRKEHSIGRLLSGSMTGACLANMCRTSF